ncbi:hypothetical protein CONPUDRAFT_167545 [Coniophora puteana RWD-64-598 SS2]|uniref:F-box domain-containing protein n=1 Tax=Coniophora puteana (strain RWD-64-598) TaxID=741705 RepID=A0A5M3MIT3_CONPW|nr:uncharacterized protein CONPUDRAFT_167545 [Coniophora puteana RWD-64-598 SS2]EIW78555.1 hypothetical protein CONPUDRAFT_167545 [Coniophora puteana RWD-64-598 SS2]
MSTTSTHRALLINEVVFNVARQTKHDRDLAMLARVSRSFSEPALDALWYQLDSFVPLLRCLPADLIGEDSNGSTLKYTLQRPITDCDWTVFLKYARRVVSLKWGLGQRTIITDGKEASITQGIHPEIQNVLITPPTSFPFPKLRNMTWEHRGAFSLLHSMLGPDTACLIIRTGNMLLDKLAMSFVAALGKLCPLVREFEWDSDVTLSRHGLDIFSSTACAWAGLTKLNVPALNNNSFRQLSSSQCLQKLTTSLHGPFPDNLHFDSPAFPALKVLTLKRSSQHTLAVFADLIKRITMSPIDLSFSADTTEEVAITELLGAISAHCDLDVLSHLHVAEDDFPLQNGDPRFFLTCPMLRPALCFRNLTSLDINTDRGIQLNDNDLLEMASAWPNLHKLELNAYAGWRTRSLVTLLVLRPLLARLPRLKSLGLAVDAERISADANSLGELVSASSTESSRSMAIGFTLDLLDSRIGSGTRIMLAVAAFLTDLFPNLQAFGYWKLFRQTWSLARPFTAADWNALFKYSRRVVSLEGIQPTKRKRGCFSNGRIQTRVQLIINDTVLTALSKPPFHLFPRLCTLKWQSAPSMAFPLLMSLLGPSVTHLNMPATLSSDQALELLSALGHMCPRLGGLGCVGEAGFSERLVTKLADVIATWDHLQSLSGLVLNGNALQSLSNSKKLMTMDVILDGSLPATVLSSPLRFPSVGLLWLSALPEQTLAPLTDFMNASQSSPSWLALDADITTDTAIADLTEAVSTHCKLESVDIFSVTEEVAGEADELCDPGEFVLTFSMIRPLSRLSNLVDLDINTARSIMLDDKSLLDLADALPKLGRLSVNENAGWRTRPRTTIYVLRGLVARLPSLTKLAVAFNALALVAPTGGIQAIPIDVGPDARTMARNMSETFKLDVLDSRVSMANTMAVAAFLSDLFPNMPMFKYWDMDFHTADEELGEDEDEDEDEDERLDPDEWSVDVYRRRWDGLCGMMQLMQRVRIQERARWLGTAEA